MSGSAPEIRDGVDSAVVLALRVIQSHAGPRTSGELNGATKLERSKLVPVDKNSVPQLESVKYDTTGNFLLQQIHFLECPRSYFS